MLEINNLKAGYSSIPVVHNVSFSVREGQIVGLIGSNGSGKSTTLKAVTGLIKPMEGDISFMGEPLKDITTHQLVEKGIAMIPEGRHLFGKMTVRDNLIMGAYLIRDKQRMKDRLNQVYEIFPRVKERLRQTAETLSGGEQQMVAIARGLMSDPKLLILDEPSLGLMPILVKEVFKFIRKINKLGITIILVEQNVNETLALSDYAYVIQNGETVIEGKGEEMLQNEEIKKAYLGL
jgi:branched-chain amino acid transport system ATP-binding protein